MKGIFFVVVAVAKIVEKQCFSTDIKSVKKNKNFEKFLFVIAFSVSLYDKIKKEINKNSVAINFTKFSNLNDKN